MPDQGRAAFHPMRGLAAVAGFVAFGLWFFTALGGFGEAAAMGALVLLVVGLLVGVFFAFASEEPDGY